MNTEGVTGNFLSLIDYTIQRCKFHEDRGRRRNCDSLSDDQLLSLFSQLMKAPKPGAVGEGGGPARLWNDDMSAGFEVMLELALMAVAMHGDNGLQILRGLVAEAFQSEAGNERS